MQGKYCLPIIKPGINEVIQSIEANEQNYGFFEIWLDYIGDLNDQAMMELIDKYPGRLVFVFRRQNLEDIKMPVKERLKLLDKLSGKDCLVDLDINCQKEDLDYAKAKDLKTIVSYHNYEETPADTKLAQIAGTIKSYKPYALKVSTFCNEASDAFRLIGFKKDLLEMGERHIVLGMGKEGEITRVFGALWGNELIFIPEAINEASAPGQLTREEFDKIMERVSK
jgi:3-dehydroquinate dehydratase type I